MEMLAVWRRRSAGIRSFDIDDGKLVALAIRRLRNFHVRQREWTLSPPFPSRTKLLRGKNLPYAGSLDGGVRRQQPRMRVEHINQDFAAFHCIYQQAVWAEGDGLWISRYGIAGCLEFLQDGADVKNRYFVRGHVGKE
jgi:hypothetical protein